MTAAYFVESDDESRHTPEPEDLWSESYYADFVDGDGTWGGWLRLGMYPNRKVAWWTAYIVGLGRTGVCSVDYALPVPAGDGLVIEDADTRVEIEIIKPLESFRLAAAAPARILSQPEQAYVEGAGTPGTLAVDLTWTTDGTPYHYSVTPRYEIPCLVTGTVTIDGQEHAVDGQGQRDHSWAARDWWAFGWCWSSARLNDGTRIHLSDIRMPGFPIFFGYVQTPPASGAAGAAGSSGHGTVHPITALTVTEVVGEHGFPTSAHIALQSGADPDLLTIAVTPLAYGPVLLIDEQRGRTSHFPRAMVRYDVADGRQGLGWIEWNQPDPA